MKKMPLAILAVCLLAACSTPAQESSEPEVEYSFNFSEHKDLDIHTELQANYLKDDLYSVNNYAWGYQDLSRPQSFSIEWDFDISILERIDNFHFEYSDNKDLKNPIVEDTREKYADVDNLKVGTTYYYRVTASVGGKEYPSEIQTFNTLDNAPRNLNISGVTNARDLGGYTVGDKRIKQNMIIRSGQFNEHYEDSYRPMITGAGKKYLLNEVGIKSEIDLRWVEDGEANPELGSSIGKEVNYYSLPMDYEVAGALEAQKEQIKNVMKVFADEKNYPIIFHCAIGTDRTGLIAFILNSLLGLDMNTIYRDYLFSNFGKINSARPIDNCKGHYEHMMSLKGSTLQEKAYNYLLSIGLSDAEVKSIQTIMYE